MQNYPITLSFEQCRADLQQRGLLREVTPAAAEDASGLKLVQPCFDSREVAPGTLFYCKGAHFQPEFLDQAAALGAVAYVAEQAYCSPAARALPALIVSDVRQAMAYLNAQFYAGVTDALQLTGITGTKGKSTVAYFLRSIFDTWMAARRQPASAILSSIDNYDGVSREESHMTTQENLELYRRFANAAASGCGQLTMEVTSQALKYNRTLGITFDTACFMNFGLDHISAIEHSDAEDYLAAKLRIFEQCRLAVVNLGSAELPRILAAARRGSAERLISFGLTDKADIWASDLVSAADGVSFLLHLAEGEHPIKLALTGRFNVENALAAIACALAAGAPISAIQEGLSQARVPGRMELFSLPDQKTVIVDYAHNLMSFEALFASVKRDYPDAPTVAVFGCPGYKAYDRRRDLAAVCARCGAAVVLTEEDSGEEPTLNICQDIAQHLRAAGGGEATIIEDREAALNHAISQAPAGAVILFTGKGRETRQKRGREYVPVLSDVQMLERYLSRC